MSRVFNFGAGPATLPEPVLKQAAEEMLDWHGSGMSVMEMSHRGKQFIGIHAQAEADLRELLAIPKNYKVLFLQGGAAGQFAVVPMNLLRGKAAACYVNTGHWATRAIAEAKRYCKVGIAASSEDANFSYAPKQDQWKVDPRRGVRALHVERDDRRRGVSLDPRHWRRPVGRRCFVAHPVAAARREPFRTDLRRRAEEHRPGGSCHRDRPRRPDRTRPPRIRPRYSTTRCRPKRTRCTTRRRLTPSTWRGWCSSG